MKPRAIIIDIDGTIADNQHRVHYLQTKPKRWQAFYDACSRDTPHEHLCELIRAIDTTKLRIILCTGRPTTHMDVTQWWLQVIGGIQYNEIFMRKEGDYRPDTVIKKEFLDMIRVRYDVVMAIDDRPSVIEMWRENGVPVLDAGSYLWDNPNEATEKVGAE